MIVWVLGNELQVNSNLTNEGTPFIWHIKENGFAVSVTAPIELLSEKKKEFQTVLKALQYILRQEEEILLQEEKERKEMS